MLKAMNFKSWFNYAAMWIRSLSLIGRRWIVGQKGIELVGHASGESTSI